MGVFLLAQQQNMVSPLPKAIGLSLAVFTSCHCSSKPVSIAWPYPIAMVAISSRVEIQFMEEKPIIIPKDLLVTHAGQSYLKLRPTAQPIVQFLHGSKIGKNASLSQSPKLKELVTARNDKYQEDAPEDEQPKDELFQDKPGTSTKRKAAAMETTNVLLDVDGTMINCLMVGNRPTKSDLTISLEPSQIEAVVKHVRSTSTTDLERPTRSYKVKKP